MTKPHADIIDAKGKHHTIACDLMVVDRAVVKLVTLDANGLGQSVAFFDQPISAVLHQPKTIPNE